MNVDISRICTNVWNANDNYFVPLVCMQFKRVCVCVYVLERKRALVCILTRFVAVDDDGLHKQNYMSCFGCISKM